MIFSKYFSENSFTCVVPYISMSLMEKSFQAVGECYSILMMRNTIKEIDKFLTNLYLRQAFFAVWEASSNGSFCPFGRSVHRMFRPGMHRPGTLRSGTHRQGTSLPWSLTLKNSV
jgi:hypothetical protein